MSHFYYKKDFVNIESFTINNGKQKSIPLNINVWAKELDGIRDRLEEIYKNGIYFTIGEIK